MDGVTLPEEDGLGVEAVQRARLAFFRIWRRGWERRLRHRITNQDIADLTGMSPRTVSRKWNGTVKIQPGLEIQLVHIDQIFGLSAVPDGCPEWFAQAIIARRLR